MSNEAGIDFDRDYEALRSGRGVVQLTGWSSISVTGADRQTFLNNFCTNDVKRLVPGTSCEAFFCNVKGKIIGHGIVGCRDDKLVIVGAPGQAVRLIEHLDRYVIREDVKLVDTTTTRAFAFAAGEPAGFEPHINWNLIGGNGGVIFESGSDNSAELPATSGGKLSSAVGENAFNAARLEAGFPLFGIDFDADNLPQEVGRDRQAISFTKGCYLGQETVARIDALGHVNQQIVGIRFYGADLPDSGTDLTLNGKPVGRVTSSTFSPQLGRPLALAMIRREANTPGTRLQSPAGECEVVVLPLAISAQ